MGIASDKTLSCAILLARHMRCADIRDITLVVLNELGFSGRLRGRDYLIEAVIRKYHTPEKPMVDGIYEEVALATGASCNKYQVEAAIRRAIRSAWKRRNTTVWWRHFPQPADWMEKAPTNTQFINELAAFLQLCEQCRSILTEDEVIAP